MGVLARVVTLAGWLLGAVATAGHQSVWETWQMVVRICMLVLVVQSHDPERIHNATSVR